MNPGTGVIMLITLKTVLKINVNNTIYKNIDLYCITGLDSRRFVSPKLIYIVIIYGRVY